MPGKLVSRMSKRKCYTLTETDTVKAASQNLHEKKVGSMPVLDKNNNVVGIISERDLSQFIYSERFNTNLPVAQIMTKKFLSCNEDDYASDTLEVMKKNKINSLPVLDKKNKIIGAINMHILIDSGIN